MRTVVDVFRGLAAGGVLLSAVVHLDLWDVQDFRQLDTIGPLFLLNAIGGLILGLVVLAWRHWLPLFAGVGFGVLTLAAFWISVVHGLFGLKEVATGSAQILAEVAELTAVVFGVAAIVLLRRDVSRPAPAAGPGRRPPARSPADEFAP